MGHLGARSAYARLQAKLDGHLVRVPDHAALRQVLHELYTPEEADLVARMPYRLASITRLSKTLKLSPVELLPRLDALADKGLVMDLTNPSNGERYYVISPLVIGIFEFTMMRTGAADELKRCANLFRAYLGSGVFYHENFGHGEGISVLRALAHDGTTNQSTEILDHESASRIVSEHRLFAVGVCSCRHEKEHNGGRKCKTSLHTCTAFGSSADYLLRHGLARESSAEELRDILDRSREEGLVLSADNVRQGTSFLCHCCSCCCNMLAGIKEFGHSNALTTSGFDAVMRGEQCSGCNRCVRACPVGAIRRQSTGRSHADTPPVLDTSVCIGCGVCATRCPEDAIVLTRSAKRFVLPESTFERVLLQSLERGTLQNLIFDDVSSRTHQMMRGFLGGFLRLSSVKRLLVSSAFRSMFLSALSSIACP